MPDRGSNAYYYGYSGIEYVNGLYGIGNGYLFEARILDTRLGKWLGVDPHAKKYPSISPYCYVANLVNIAIDPDGRDIIVLSAPCGAHGVGHAAVLIGNDVTGWYLYSKNGGQSSSVDSRSPSGDSFMPTKGKFYATLEDFKKDNIYDPAVSKPFSYYEEAYQIKSDEATDKKMKEAASQSVSTPYNLVTASCVDVASDALRAGGFDPGWEEQWTVNDKGELVDVGPGLNDRPNIRFDKICENNAGKRIDDKIDWDILDFAKQENIDKFIEDYSKETGVAIEVVRENVNKLIGLPI